jgi:hypothetical protein
VCHPCSNSRLTIMSGHQTCRSETAVTEDEARTVAKKETEYCYVLATAWEGTPNESICLERIFTKGGCEEIRMA